MPIASNDSYIPSQASLLRRFKYDPDTGFLIHCINGQVNYGKVAGYIKHNKAKNTTSYIYINMHGTAYLSHRIIWKMIYGELPDLEIDHIDGDGTNNKLHNLRVVGQSANRKNARIGRLNTSGCVGVYYNKKSRKWEAALRSDGVLIHLGLFCDKLQAIAARKEAERLYGFHETHGEIRTK